MCENPTYATALLVNSCGNYYTSVSKFNNIGYYIKTTHSHQNTTILCIKRQQLLNNKTMVT